MTWLTKSQNIYFDGEKGNNLIERVHGFLKRRKSASETSSYVDLLESQSQVEDESVTCTTSDHLQNSASNSEKVYSLSNNDITVNKNTNFDHKKQGEAILHAESINHDNSTMKLLSENVLNRPINMHNRASNEYGKHVNTLNLPRDVYDTYNYDSELRLLNAKVERLAHNLTNKLEDIALEFNIIKENKPYSILILENAVNDLKQEKHELSKKNDLREVNMTLSHTISDLRLANKNLESEKASLLTALKLIQDDYAQMTNKTSAANQNYCSTMRLDDETTRKSSKSERTHGTNNIGKEQSTSGYVEPSHNPYQVLSHHDDDSKNSTNTANVSESEQPDQTVSRLVNDETEMLSETKAHSFKEKTASQSKIQVNVAIVGDSMLKYINSGKLRKSLNQNLLIKTFPGANVADMQHYVKPTMAHAPECLILHVGTNDLKESSSRQISTSIANLGLEIKKKLPKTKLMISEIIMRKDDPQINMKVKEVNSKLSQVCTNNNWRLITHRNIQAKHINPYGVHLNKQGTAT